MPEAESGAAGARASTAVRACAAAQRRTGIRIQACAPGAEQDRPAGSAATRLAGRADHRTDRRASRYCRAVDAACGPAKHAGCSRVREPASTRRRCEGASPARPREAREAFGASAVGIDSCRRSDASLVRPGEARRAFARARAGIDPTPVRGCIARPASRSTRGVRRTRAAMPRERVRLTPSGGGWCGGA